jgi:hypothetical protein
VIYKYEDKKIIYRCEFYKPVVSKDFINKHLLYKKLKLYSNFNCRNNKDVKICVNNGILFFKKDNEEYYTFDIENAILDEYFNYIYPTINYSLLHTEAKIINFHHSIFYFNDFDFNWSICKRKITLRKI